MRRWRWLIALVFVVSWAYVGSYAVTYRFLLGSDTELASGRGLNSRYHVGVGYKYIVERRSPVPNAKKVWNLLDRYYYLPVLWLIDRTPLQSPMLKWAAVWDVDEQVEADSVFRVVIPQIIAYKLRNRPQSPGRINL
ncbi:MAG: hypothetical protein SH850_11340 [Planctomycetaceae bacterium]|nr:hypothetical protein [Planctomycetaceae bacterium]